MSSPGTVEVTLIKKELTTLIAAIEYRLKHLQDLSIDPTSPHRMDAGYDEEILEPMLAALRELHEKEFGLPPERKY